MLRPRWVGLLLAVTVLAVSFLPSFRTLVDFPDYIAIAEGETAEVALGLPLNVHVRADRAGVISINGSLLEARWEVFPGSPLAIEPAAAGEYTLEMRLFGFIPFRRVTVDVLPPVEVIPGGHSIGVMLRSDGVLVVGLAPVEDAGGRIYPAREAGIRTGDVIVSVNGEPAGGVGRVADLVHLAGMNDRPVELEVRRAGAVHRFTLNPVYSSRQERFLIGVWIRDAAAGVGTLTFYHEDTGVFGALGHVILDADTRGPVDAADGQIIAASVTAIEKGRQGRPGEKVGRFEFNGPALGSIERNTDYGVFGSMERSLDQPLFNAPVRVALASEVEEGRAEIITVVEGERLERFQVEIERILSRQPGGKNLIVRITDPRLLEATGGIVQGMSGSPILQRGRLVGAVTHVFVNDPTRGYGVLAQWMVVHSGLLEALNLEERKAG